MRPLYVAERDLEEVERDPGEGQPRCQPAAASLSLPPHSRGNKPLISSVMKLFLDRDLRFLGKSRHRVGVKKDEHDGQDYIISIIPCCNKSV